MSDIFNRLDRALDSLELKTIMILAASTIAGRKVAIRFKTPATADLDGSVTVRPDGTPDVRIRPDLPADRLLNVYLHELAHCRLHTHKMPRSTMYQAPPESRSFNEYVKQDANQADETEAEAQVNVWLRYGHKHTDPGDHLGIIEALYNYYKTH
jgi:hypothetical protein